MPVNFDESADLLTSIRGRSTGTFRCKGMEGCGSEKEVPVTERSELVRPGRVIAVYLPRGTDADHTKDDRFMMFPHVIPDIDGHRYKLVATVNHIGRTLAHGHYVMYGLVDGRWFRADGEKVWHVHADYVSSEHHLGGDHAHHDHETVAMLVYERGDPA